MIEMKKTKQDITQIKRNKKGSIEEEGTIRAGGIHT
jgi:hypothetical protein